jgi:rare lipoprotein A (peptidoglycan hydrolase)
VKLRRALAAPLALAALALTMGAGLAGCFSAPRRTAPAPAPASPAPPVLSVPPAAASVPDAIPRLEPRARYGNPPFYDVFGKRYYVLSSSVGYRERGVASWYGPGFHKERTSTGEPYDMYGMTAAHKTLPLPAYVRVTNLQNGRSIVVRVNDRGPFVGNRIIDLSYTAAAKLDMLRNGTAMVEVRAIDPTVPPLPPVVTASTIPAVSTLPTVSTSAAASATPTASSTPAAAPVAAALVIMPLAATPSAAAPPATPPAAAPSTAVSLAAAPGATTPPALPPGIAASNAAPEAASASGAAPAAPGFTRPTLFIQAGAFSDPANAERLAQKLRGDNLGKVFVRNDVIAGRRMYRVRIGPVPDVAEFDRVVAALELAGIGDAHLALD